MLVHQILKSKSTSDVFTIAPQALVSEAAAELSARRIGSLVVSTGDGTAAGILSERDIVREIGRRGTTCLSEKVSDMMTRALVTCRLNDDAENLLETMTNGRFRHMPVVEDGKLVGIVTLGDLVKARLSEVSMEKKALEGMIMGH